MALMPPRFLLDILYFSWYYGMQNVETGFHIGVRGANLCKTRTGEETESRLSMESRY